MKGFLPGIYDEVYVVYAEFVSMGKQVPVLKQILPIAPLESSELKIKVMKTRLISQNIFVSRQPLSFWGFAAKERLCSVIQCIA